MKKLFVIIAFLMSLLPSIASAQSMVLKLNGKNVIVSPIIMISPSIAGDLTFLGGGTITTTANGHLRLDPHGAGFTIIGDAAAGGFTHLSDGNDLGVSGKVHVLGNSYFAQPVKLGHTLDLNSNRWIYMGTSSDTALAFTTTQTNRSVVWGLNDAVARIILTPRTNRAYNYELPAQLNAEIALTSDNGESNVEVFRQWHSGDDAVFINRKGAFIWGVEAQRARGTMTLTGVPNADQIFDINATTIMAKVDGSTDLDFFTIGGDADETCDNIITTINEGTEMANCHAYRGAGFTIIVEWLTGGVAGNAITFTEALTNCTIDGGGTLGGTHTAVDADSSLMSLDETGAVDAKSFTGDHKSSDGTAGITDNTSYWFCTAADCSTSCQVTIKDGLITGCL